MLCEKLFSILVCIDPSIAEAERLSDASPLHASSQVDGVRDFHLDLLLLMILTVTALLHSLLPL